MDLNKSKEYYESLVGNYLEKARNFVREYDQLTRRVAQHVLDSNPKRALDIGQGVGNIELQIFEKSPSMSIVCVDTEVGMVKAAECNLEEFKDRVLFNLLDVRGFSSKDKFDVVFTNMTLHNIPIEEKLSLLKSIYSWVEDQGCFVWGDLISFDDKNKVTKAFEDRKKFAIENGEDPNSHFFVTNFHKEENLDWPLTPKQTISLLKEAGFSQVEQTWEYDNFGLFVAYK